MKHWQIELFNRSVKKKGKFKKIETMLSSLRNKKCLDIGCGTGVISYLLRKKGGEWTSIDSDKTCVLETKDIVKKRVFQRNALDTKFKSDSFDIVVCLDIIEHIKDDNEFLKEMNRILKIGGILYLTTPNTKGLLILNKLKNLVGLTPDKYGHVREGYSIDDIEERLKKNRFRVDDYSTYSKFFTEIIELVLNLGYMMISKKRAKGYNAEVSPSSKEDVNKVKKILRIYSIAYPFIYAISLLDVLVPFKGYGLIVKSVKNK